METGWGDATTGQRLAVTAKAQPPCAPSGSAVSQRWLSSLFVLLVALAIAAAAGVALSIGLLTFTMAVLLSACAAFMALVAALLGWLSERGLRQDCLALQEALEASERHAETQRVRRAWLLQLTASLQQAGHPAELAQRLLSGLARGLVMQQGLCCYWDEDGQLLRAAARYGGEGADAEDVLTRQPLLAPLLLEVARSRREIVIASPGATYLRLTSGLGDAEPAELLVLPLEHRGRLIALLELAALQPVSGEARALLAEVVPMFAICLELLSRTDGSQNSSPAAAGAAAASEGVA